MFVLVYLQVNDGGSVVADISLKLWARRSKIDPNSLTLTFDYFSPKLRSHNPFALCGEQLTGGEIRNNSELLCGENL